VYTGRVIHLDLETVRFPDGSSGEMEVFRHPGASAVLPVLSAPGASDPTILLIRQYRFVTGTSIWEVPAGRLDPGEAPEACARRELLEETGATAERFDLLATFYTTPGFTDERIHLFAAFGVQVDEARARREKDEFMEVAARPLSTVLGMIRDGEIVDGKTMIAVLYYAGFRAGL
jgi:ADP-ribose pyrophosphatase